MTYEIRLRFRAPWRTLAHVAGAAARAALAHQRAPRGGLTVVLQDESGMKRLHGAFAGERALTDVLSFPDGSLDPDTKSRYFGDIVVCVPVARRQAKRARHPLEDEIRLLTVHGVLHLLGFDHATASERSRMWSAQEAVLNAGTDRASA
ncbi:MAG TPA: rRNA maturation RNase YbeY [Anaerolineales bacterium]|nr:rRNA maturation RNase YbeY [Anaerolineales bacterium]